MTIHPTCPPFVVEAGPCPGVYFSREAYEEHLQRKGIDLGEYFKNLLNLETPHDQSDLLHYQFCE